MSEPLTREDVIMRAFLRALTVDDAADAFRAIQPLLAEPPRACETCRHYRAFMLSNETSGVQCAKWRRLFPRTVNGQPFYCAAWQPKGVGDG
jgi:hypothetical protein